jgi:RHS repeat-associated protein
VRPRRALRFETLEGRTLLSTTSPNVLLSVVLPPSSSYGVNNSLTVDYTNTGTSAAPAPVFALSADNAKLWLPSDPAVGGTSLQLLATAPSGPAGTLAPGATGSIVVEYTSTSSTASAINFSIDQFTSGQTINWSALQSSMQPSNMSAAAWGAVFANFTANLGSTTDTYQAALDADATYLAQLGQPTNDVARLVNYEINKANDVFSTTTLGDNVDASLPVPGGLSLSFERWFQPDVSSRYQLGTLGLGWTDNWAVTASADASGDVTINESGVLRYFALSNGSYVPPLGDNGTLTKLASGGYQLTEANGTSTVFNSNGTLDYVEDSNGNTITTTYTSGLLTKLTASNGEYLTLSYTNGLLTTLADSTNTAAEDSTYTYSGQTLVGYKDELGTTSYTYVTGQGAAAQDALASITNANGTQQSFSYDAEGRLIGEHQNNNQQSVTFSYGAAGGMTTTDADGNTTTMLADDNGQVGETIDALGNVTNYSYDAAGDLTAEDGPQGADYAYTYDSKGNLTSETDPLGLTTLFTYNANNDLTSSTDAKGNSTSYTYDANNDLLSVTYANGTQEKYTYNPLGEATQFVNANSKTLTSTYNSQGLVATEAFADGSSYSYTYDAHGNMLTAKSASGTITFLYQNSAAPDLLTEVEYPNGQTLTFTYNTIGQRTQSVDQTGFTVKYVYDALGRLQELTDGSGNLLVEYVYDAAGNLIQQDNGNGTFAVYRYDGNGDVLSITNYAPSTGGTSFTAAQSAVNSFDDYSYDALGNVLTDTNQDGRWVYSYDADSQLTDAFFTPNNTDPDGLTSQSLQYVYDAAGNRTSQTVNGVTTTYVVNNVNEYTTSTASGVTTSYVYDNNGNLTSQTTSGSTTTYTYNQLNELTGISGPGQTATYTYDALGNRNGQTVNGTTAQFLIDPMGSGNVVSAYNSSGALLVHYTYGFGLVSQTPAGGTAAYYDFNLNGSTIGITGTAGTYVNKYTYLPFGQTTTVAATLANPFTYAGQLGVMQDSANLLNMRAREYSPVTGQFLSNDPINILGGDANVRRYVQNNPLATSDPLGATPSTELSVLQVLQVASRVFNIAITPTPSGGSITKLAADVVSTLAQKHINYYGGVGVRDPQWAGIVRRMQKLQAVARQVSRIVGTVEGGLAANAGRLAAGAGRVLLGVGGALTFAETGVGILVGMVAERWLQDVQIECSPGGDIYKFFQGVGAYISQLSASGKTQNTDFSPSQTFYEGYTYTALVAVVNTPVSSATTSFTDAADATYDIPSSQVQTTWQVVSGNTTDIYATVTFPEFGQFGYTVTINGNDVVADPGHDSVIVYETPVIVNPVNFTIPTGGAYSGPVATFTDLGVDQGPDGYSATLLPSDDGSITGLESNGGKSYTVYGDVTGANLNPNGSYSVDVTVSDTYQAVGALQWGTATVTDGVAFVNAGQSRYSTSVTGRVLQASSGNPADPPLAIIDTTDPTITSASQVTVTVGSAPNQDMSVPLITGTTLTRLPGGITQIVINGVASSAEAGVGPVPPAPLNVTLGSESTMTVQIGVDESVSDYVVNPAAVTASVGQSLDDVEVATLAGPATGTYSATINWGDGDTSPGQITAMGGNLFSVSGSKPHPYAAVGFDTITVTVSGPGSDAAPAAESLATVSPGTPAITWPTPADIPFGTALGATQLDATASVPGTFVYTPASSAVIDAGNNQTLSVTFTPRDTTDYLAATKSVSINVRQAIPTVSVTDAGGTYNGSPFPATATVAGVNGSPAASLEGISPALTYYVGSAVSGSSSSTAPSAVGTYTVVASFAGSTDYLAAQSNPVTFTIIAAPVATPGLYDPTSSWWYLRNSNTTGGASITAGYGPPGGNWIPLVGDWTGNGIDTIGLYNPATGFFYLRNSNTTGVGDITFFYGDPGQGWIPVVGDWTGQKSSAGFPIDTVGMYDPKTCTWYLRNELTTGVADITIGYGPPAAGWLPLVGDWDGNGTTTVGLYAPATGYFYLRNSNTTGVGNIAFFYGDPTKNWTPVAGDWTGDGHDSIGMYDPSTGTWYLRNELSTGVADMTFGYGPAGAGWLPVVGDWTGTSSAPALAANSLLSSATASAPLSHTDLQPIVAAAFVPSAAAGTSSTVLAPMTQANYVTSGLPGAELGQVGGNTAYVAQNTAGQGSSIDSTAATDEEFTRLGSGLPLQAVDPQAVDYAAGLGDLDTSVTSLLSGLLPTGVQRLPGATPVDAVLAERDVQ